ncbi:MAG TPA: hypothetical protein V6C86_24180 [Oculatellaceae cyanobacterium]
MRKKDCKHEIIVHLHAFGSMCPDCQTRPLEEDYINWYGELPRDEQKEFEAQIKNRLSLPFDYYTRLNERNKWRAKYKVPQTHLNRTDRWEMPSIETIVHDVATCGGNFKTFLKVVCGHDKEASLLLAYQVYELLGNPQHKEHLKEFAKTIKRGDRIRTRLGTDETLDQYCSGNMKNSNMILRIGENSMPETFKKDAPVGDSDDDEKEESELDKTLSAILGSQKDPS